MPQKEHKETPQEHAANLRALDLKEAADAFRKRQIDEAYKELDASVDALAALREAMDLRLELFSAEEAKDLAAVVRGVHDKVRHAQAACAGVVVPEESVTEPRESRREVTKRHQSGEKK